MTKHQFDSASLTNLVDADPTPWKTYAILVGVVLVAGIGGAALYTWHTQDLADTEAKASAELYNAKTVEDKVKVADSYPTTATAARALIAAAQDDYDAGKYPESLTLNDRVITDYSASPLKESAELGKAAALVQTGKVDDALVIYKDIGRLATVTPYAGYAWFQVATIYQGKHDSDSLRQALIEALADTNSRSQFRQQLEDLQASIKATAVTPPSPAPEVQQPAPAPASVSTAPQPVSPIPAPSASPANSSAATPKH